MNHPYNWFERSLHTILEGIEEKIPLLTNILLGNRSRWAGKEKHSPEEVADFIRSLQEWDPTKGQARFVPYIVRQLANRHLAAEPGKIEDLQRISNAVKYFHTNSKTPQWQHPKDINQFPDWRQLENIANTTAPIEYQSKRQSNRVLKAGIEDLGSIVVPNIHHTTYQLYRITEPEAAIILGKGTRWCTSTISTVDLQNGKLTKFTQDDPPAIEYPDWHPRSGEQRPLKWLDSGAQQGFAITAARYLGMRNSIDNGPLYVILQTDDGPQSDNIGRSKQLIQFTQSAVQFKDPVDREVQIISAALHYALSEWVQIEPNIGKILRRVRHGTDINDVQNYMGFPIRPQISSGSEMFLAGPHGDGPSRKVHTLVDLYWDDNRSGGTPLSYMSDSVYLALIETEHSWDGLDYPRRSWILNEETDLDDASSLEILQIALASGLQLDYEALEQYIQKRNYDAHMSHTPAQNKTFLRYAHQNQIPIISECVSTLDEILDNLVTQLNV